MADRDTEHALLREHFLAVEVARWLTILRCYIGRFAIGSVSGADIAEFVRHLPNAVLIGNENVTLPPGQPVGLVEALRMPFDEFRLAVAIGIPEQSEMSLLLLGNDDVTVW